VDRLPYRSILPFHFYVQLVVVVSVVNAGDGLPFFLLLWRLPLKIQSFPPLLITL